MRVNCFATQQTTWKPLSITLRSMIVTYLRGRRQTRYWAWTRGAEANDPLNSGAHLSNDRYPFFPRVSALNFLISQCNIRGIIALLASLVHTTNLLPNNFTGHGISSVHPRHGKQFGFRESGSALCSPSRE
jgi:hypothetical protein